MGLDMYLNKRVYVKNWDHTDPDKKFDVSVKKGGKLYKAINKDNVKYIIEEVAYWRKANAIHQWFVDNVQEGNDDCKTYSVRREDLEELLETINKVLGSTKLVSGKVHNGTSWSKETGEVENWEEGSVLEDSSVAEELLPTQDGFFFGGTNYDQWYWADLEYTQKALTDALKDTDADSFEYYASW